MCMNKVTQELWLVVIFYSIFKWLTVYKHHIMDDFHAATYFPPKWQLSRGGSLRPICFCKSFIILKASAIYSAHPGDGVDKLQVRTWPRSKSPAMETLLRVPNTTEWILVEHATAKEGSFALAVLVGCIATVRIKRPYKVRLQNHLAQLSSPTVVNSTRLIDKLKIGKAHCDTSPE